VALKLPRERLSRRSKQEPALNRAPSRTVYPDPRTWLRASHDATRRTLLFLGSLVRPGGYHSAYRCLCPENTSVRHRRLAGDRRGSTGHSDQRSRIWVSPTPRTSAIWLARCRGRTVHFCILFLSVLRPSHHCLGLDRCYAWGSCLIGPTYARASVIAWTPMGRRAVGHRTICPSLAPERFHGRPWKVGLCPRPVP
jgi:hypothetical protein